MNNLFRRDFFKTAGLAFLASGFSFPAMAATNQSEKVQKLLKPLRLKPGASVALIAPSSPPSAEKMAKAFENLAAMGYKVVPGKNLYAQYGHLAGSDEQRLADLHWAFEDTTIDAVWCVRGGYGASRLLPHLDYDLIRRNPKPLIGYSDITALHLAIHARTGLVTFHGPVAAADYPANTLEHLQQVLVHGTGNHVIAAPEADFPGEEYRPFTITSGKASGTLTGGNLALLAALAGTPFAPVFRDKIAFIEDVGEQPYRLDRMFTQLLQSTDLAKAAGIALGVFNECQPKTDSASLSLTDTLRDLLGGLGIPVVYGIPFGHVSYQATLPYGIRAALDASAKTLTLLEPAVR